MPVHRIPRGIICSALSSATPQSQFYLGKGLMRIDLGRQVVVSPVTDICDLEHCGASDGSVNSIQD